LSYYTKKRQSVANYLLTSNENEGLVKEEEIAMSAFYAECNSDLGSKIAPWTPHPIND